MFIVEHLKYRKKQGKNQNHLVITFGKQNYAVNLLCTVAFENLLGALVFQRRGFMNCLESEGEGVSPQNRNSFHNFIEILFQKKDLQQKLYIYIKYI